MMSVWNRLEETDSVILVDVLAGTVDLDVFAQPTSPHGSRLIDRIAEAQRTLEDMVSSAARSTPPQTFSHVWVGEPHAPANDTTIGWSELA